MGPTQPYPRRFGTYPPQESFQKNPEFEHCALQTAFYANSKANFYDLLFWWVCALQSISYILIRVTMGRTELIIVLIVLAVGTIAIVLIAVIGWQ